MSAKLRIQTHPLICFVLKNQHPLVNTLMVALGILSRGFIKKYKLKQNLVKIKLDYIELPTKKHTNA